MRRKLSWLLALCLSVLFYPVASDSQVWVGTSRGVARLQTATGQLDSSIELPGATDLAADEDGSLWAITADRLFHLQTHSPARTSWPLGALGIADASQLRVDPYDHSVWLSDGRQLVHASPGGKRLATRRTAVTVRDFSFAIDESVWTLEGRNAVQYGADAERLRSIELPPALANADRIAVDSLHNAIWLLGARRVSRIELMTGREVWHDNLADDTRAAVLDPLTGTFWRLDRASLTGWAIDGTVEMLDLGSAGVASAQILALDGAAGILWVGDRSAITRVYPASHELNRLPLPDKPLHLATAPLVLKPSISLRGAAHREPTSLEFGIDALCFGSSCKVPRDYLAALSFDATVSRKEMGQYVVVDPDRKRATLSVPGAPARTQDVFAQATDAFGHQSDAIGALPGTTGKARSSNKVKPAATDKVTASIASPATGSGFPVSSNITFTATASSTGGTISKVQYYKGTTLLGTATTAPYSFTWGAVAAGSYSITARATDSKSTTGISTAVSIKVYTAPTVSISAPANNASYAAPASITIRASAADTNATISKVDFYNGGTHLGTATASPYSYSWTGVAAGAYTLTAVATNAFGATTTSSAVTVLVRGAPVVSITSPANNASFTPPATITINASASEINGTISKVAFYKGATLLKSITAAPYTYTWSNVAAGSYSLTAKATDANRVTTTSAAVSITVSAAHYPPSVSITSPASGTTYNAPATISIAASASETNGTISRIDFYQGTTLVGSSTTSPYGATWSNVAAGSYSLTAIATDTNSVQTTSSPVSVSVLAPPTVSITGPVTGTVASAPATANLTVNASSGNGAITRVDYYRGTTLIGSSTTAPFGYSWSNISSGSYNIVAKATDAKGAVGTSVPVFLAVDSADTCPAQGGQVVPAIDLGSAAPAIPPAERNRSFENLPRSFEPNAGQAPAGVQFLSRRGSSNILIRAGAIDFARSRPSGGSEPAISVAMLGADANTHAEGVDKVDEISNYMTGKDPSQWMLDVPHYAKVRFHDLYPGVDQIFYDNGGKLEYDLTIGPGVSADQIRMAVTGARSVALDRSGALRMRTAHGTLVQQRPVAYQIIGGHRHNVPAAYRLDRREHVSFAIGAHDALLPLVIDPVLVYSSYFGVSTIKGIAVDHCGEAVVVGQVGSYSAFPSTPGAYQPGNGSTDYLSFVAKFNASGTGLVYSTFLGAESLLPGTSLTTINAVSVDATGHAYVAGTAYPDSFPATGGALDTSKAISNGTPTAFAAKFSPDGSALLYYSYFGGTGSIDPVSGITHSDVATGIAVDSSGNAFITGNAQSDNFPTTAGAYQPAKGALNTPTLTNAFVAKLNAQGSGLLYATYFGGGTAGEGGGVYSNALAIDSAGDVYFGGYATNSIVPTTPGVYMGTYPGTTQSAYISRLNPSGSALTYSTYFHGNTVNGIAVDSPGYAYVTGGEGSNGVALNEVKTGQLYVLDQSISDGENDAFVVKLKPDGSDFVYWTLWGGCGGTNCFTLPNVGNSIAVDASGNVVVAGYTSSSIFPVLHPLQSYQPTTDAFVTELNSTGSAMLYSTLLSGATHVNTVGSQATGVALGTDGTAYVAGDTDTTDFPVTSGAYETTASQGSDFGFVLHISPLRDTATALAASPSSIAISQPVTLTATVTGFNTIPTGTVTFEDGSTVLGTATLGAPPLAPGTAVLMLTTLAGGQHSLTAVYNGDTNHDPSTSEATAFTVNDPFAIPSVQILSPTDGTSVVIPQGQYYSFGISVQATAGTGNVIQTIRLVGTVASLQLTTPSNQVSYTFPYDMARGSAVFVVAATDNCGNTAYSAPVRVTVNTSSNAPSVAMTAPADGTSVPIGGQVTLSATATPSGGNTIQLISFYGISGGTSIAYPTVFAASGSTTTGNLPAGNYEFYAEAVDSANNTALSPFVHVTVPAAPAPSVYLSSPVSGASYLPSATIPVQAEAVATGGGTVSKVDFFANGTKIGTATAPPYNITWSGMSRGAYTITAVATDSLGQTANSRTASIIVDQPPAVVLTSPPSGALFGLRANAILGASASESGGSIARVDFWATSPTYGKLDVGFSSTPPYNANWTAALAGPYTLTAVATDDLGTTATSAPVSVSVFSNTPPSLTWLEPVTSAMVDANDSVTLGVTASSTTSTIARVDFYANGQYLGTSNAPPYLMPWNNVPAGSSLVEAIATDATGASNTIGSTITGIPLTVNVTNLTDGQTVNSDNTPVTGTIQAPPNSGVTVNGVVAAVLNTTAYVNGQTGGTTSFYLSSLPLTPGPNVITVTVTTEDGQTASQVLTIGSTGPAPFELTVDNSYGVGAFNSTYTVTNNSGYNITSIGVDWNGDGVVDYWSPSPVFAIGWGGNTVAYWTDVTVTDDNPNVPGGDVYHLSIPIVAQYSPDLDTMLRGVWGRFEAGLSAQDQASALTRMSAAAQSTYSPAFSDLSTNLPSIVGSFSALQSSMLSAQMGEYAVNRTIAGSNDLFLIYFSPDADGVWRIDSM